MAIKTDIAVLDYRTGSVMLYSTTKDGMDMEEIETFLINKGYNLDEISYMTYIDDKIKVIDLR